MGNGSRRSTGSGLSIVVVVDPTRQGRIADYVVQCRFLDTALAFDLVDEAARAGGLWPTAAGFLAGALVYGAANAYLARGMRRLQPGTSTANDQMSNRTALVRALSHTGWPRPGTPLR